MKQALYRFFFQEKERELRELQEDKINLAQELKKVKKKREQIKEAKQKQETDLLEEKSKLAIQVLSLEKLLEREKQGFQQKEFMFQEQQRKALSEILEHSKKLIARLEKEEDQIKEKLQKSLERQGQALEEKGQEEFLLKEFLGKCFKIEKIFYIERKKDEKKCILHYENGSREEKENFSLRDFIAVFPENFAFCNRSILVNKHKDFVLLEQDENDWVLSYNNNMFQITKHNFKSIKEAFAFRKIEEKKYKN